MDRPARKKSRGAAPPDPPLSLHHAFTITLERRAGRLCRSHTQETAMLDTLDTELLLASIEDEELDLLLLALEDGEGAGLDR